MDCEARPRPAWVAPAGQRPNLALKSDSSLHRFSILQLPATCAAACMKLGPDVRAAALSQHVSWCRWVTFGSKVSGLDAVVSFYEYGQDGRLLHKTPLKIKVLICS